MSSSILRISLTFILGLTGCSVNVYQPLVNAHSDPALYQDAQNQMNAQQWDKAISDIQSMTTAGQGQRNVMFTFATALAGKCGFQLVNFYNYLSRVFSGGATVSSLTLLLMQAYQGATINMLVNGVIAPVNTTDTYCSWSQQIMDNIQTQYGTWTSDEQFFSVNFSLAKIGMILAITAGQGNTQSGGLLIPDATFDSCQAASISDFYTTQITTGLSIFLQNINALSGIISIPTVGGLSVTSVWCGAPYQINPTPQFAFNFCTHTTPIQVTANDRKNIRGALTSSQTQPEGFGVIALLDKTTYPNSSSDPGSNIWQCDGTAYNMPGAGVEGLLGCCP
jgi:hypothetical protein